MIMQLCDFEADLLHHLPDLSIYAHPLAPNRCYVLAGEDREDGASPCSPRTQVVDPIKWQQNAVYDHVHGPWRLLGGSGRPPLVEDVEGDSQEQNEALDKGLNLSAEAE